MDGCFLEVTDSQSSLKRSIDGPSSTDDAISSWLFTRPSPASCLRQRQIGSTRLKRDQVSSTLVVSSTVLAGYTIQMNLTASSLF
jgi:hypothetical protein